jgi:hypothetical protein
MDPLPPPRSDPTLPPVEDAVFRAAVERNTETLKSLSLLSTEALKASLLINGGAIVALMTYANAAGSATRGSVVRSLTLALACYIVGVFCAALSLGLGFKFQLEHFNYRTRQENRGVVRERADAGWWTGTIPDEPSSRTHETLLGWAFWVGAGSIAAFLTGSIAAVLTLGAAR